MNLSGERKNNYLVKRIETCREGWHSDLPVANVDIFPWKNITGNYCPVVKARIAVYEDSFLVFMETDETKIRTKEKGFSALVFTDSCMEFFLMPDPVNSFQYINFELTPVGAMYLSIGTHRYDRHDIRLENYAEFFQVKTMVHDKGWNIEFCIPRLFLQRCFPLLELKPLHIMRGNLYKCGDKTSMPHYGCWSPIDLPEPDFHCPAFFGNFMIN